MRIVRALFQKATQAKPWDKFLYNASGFNRLGLRKDDLLYESPEVKEALRRLPEDLYNERVYRVKRAMQLQMTHSILPEEEWTKWEEDKPYLTPYVDEVIKEVEEKKNWGKQ